MTNVVALHWTEPALHYVVVQEGQIKAAASVPVVPDMDPSTLGHRLAEVLAPYSLGRASAVVALGRSALEWQHLSLPPCPAEELPDVVRLQLDHDMNSSDEVLGFDFLPLRGDDQAPYEVLAVSMAVDDLARIREFCRGANLTLERIVPLAAGWPALTRQASPSVASGTRIMIAPLAGEATLWATQSGKVVLFRQFQLASKNDLSALSSAVESELRRTLLALSQHSDVQTPTISLVGQQQDELTKLAHVLDGTLQAPVRSLDVLSHHPGMTWEVAEMSTLPLVGLAVDESQAHQPLVDFLHPRRRPRAEINVRTYALAATAGALCLAVLAWSGYSRLQSPLNQAAKDQAELTLLEEPLDDLQGFEQRAAAIRDRQAETPNLLVHLQQLSKSLRPKALENKEFLVDQDVVLEKFALNKRKLTLDALARNSRAVQPLEVRLRASAYPSERTKSDPSEVIKEYPWQLISTIEITTASDRLDETADDASTEEPQS